MRLCTRADGSRDGELLVVARDGRRALSARGVAGCLQRALDDWSRTRPALERLAARVEAGEGEPLDVDALCAPLPRAYEWIDGSAFLEHVRLVRRARGAEPPATLETEPLMYQGGSGHFLSPREAIPLQGSASGLDYEAEVCVILGDVPRGVSASAALGSVCLLVLANDVTLRNLVPAELAKGFGFFQSKPATAFSPFAVTPDELGGAYDGGRLRLPVRSFINDQALGTPDAGEMHFSFGELIAHAARTRQLTAGTILGSGTVSNRDASRGVSCLAERRTREILESGAATTPFLKPGDRVRIEVQDATGWSVFGSIEQQVVDA